MSDAGALEYGLAYAADVLGVALAWRRPRYLPVAGLLLSGTGIDLARRALAGSLIRPARAAIRAQGLNPDIEPLHGLARAAGHLSQALFIAWPLLIPAVAIWIFQRRRPWWLLGVWSVAVGVFVFGYHHLRGEAAQAVYIPIELGSAVVAVAALIQWTWEKRSASVEQGAMLLIILLEVVVSMTFPGGVFGQWPLARRVYGALYLVLIVVQGGAICWPCGSRPSSSPQ